jgi:YVTN family beta-propeller protein
MGESRGSQVRRQRRTRRLIAAFLPVVALGVLIVALEQGRRPATTAPPTVPSAPVAQRTRRPERLGAIARRSGSLLVPVQDAVAAPAGPNRVALVAGLSAADTSTSEIRIAGPSGDRPVGNVPTALHDAAAARLGAFVYLFGGGDGVTQHATIVRIDPTTWRTSIVGHLPAPSSDQSSAAIGGSAYIVGGFTGSAWLDTIVRFRPSTGAQVVAHLPTAVRYAAVTAVDGTVVIAGGSLPDGTAGTVVYAYRPGGHVSRIGDLPAATTHATAAAIGRLALIIGGRGGASDSQSSRIVAVDPAARTVRTIGTLRTPLSDAAAASAQHSVLVFGGRSASGTVADIVRISVTHHRMRTVTRRVPANVYSAAGAGELTGAARLALPRIYVPNSRTNTVDVIDPHTYKVIARFPVGGQPQHVVPAWDLRTLYVTSDVGNTLTPIDPRTGKPGNALSVADPYNMYFTTTGRYAIVVAERLARLDFRDPHSFRLHRSVHVPCSGIDHMDFSADGSYLLASCEFSGQIVKVDVASERVVGTLQLPDGAAGMPQDVKLSPDGKLFYVADMHANGVWKIDGATLKVTGFLATGAGTHGLYPSRDARSLYVTNRDAGTISVVSFRTQRVVATWHLRGGGSPDMGGVSADGKVLWLSGRYNSVVYAISTRNGALLAKIPVGSGPHGLCVWPQPGRYSLGHTGILR